MRKIAAIAALSLALSLPCAPASADPGMSDSEQFKAQVDAEQRMTVPVRIGATNAPKPNTYAFVIDTGSQTTAVARSIAETLALPAARNARIVGVGGINTAPTAIVDELGLGSRSFYGVQVVLFEARDIGADGIVGVDSLQRQRVLLDFARNRFTVGDVHSLGGNDGYDIIVTARRRLGQLIMADADIDGVRTDIIIDTGAHTSIGNRALQQALGRHAAEQSVTLVSVTGQSATGQLGYPHKLTIGTADISNPQVAFVDAPVFDVLKLNRRPALLLGMRELRLFKRIAIDFTTRKIYFDLPQSSADDRAGQALTMLRK